MYWSNHHRSGQRLPDLFSQKFNLSFLQIEVSWVIVLPNGKQLEASAICYQGALQQNRNSNRFNLIEANVITCQ